MANVSKKSNSGNKSSKAKTRPLKVSVNLLLGSIDKVFNIKNVTRRTTIHQFKNVAELITGVPAYLQRLHYLDDGESFCDVSGGKI